MASSEVTGTPRTDDKRILTALADRAHATDHDAPEVPTSGVELDQLESELWLYGFRVLKNFLRTGRIIAVCAELGRPVFMTEEVLRTLHSSLQDRDELAVETLIRAVPYFRKKVLERGRWDHNKSSLRTYFIGACAMSFSVVFQKWNDARTTRMHELGTIEHPGDVASKLSPHLSKDPATIAQVNDTLRKIMRRARPEARSICLLLLQGMTYAEVGEALDGISSRAVEGHMHRLRRTVRTMGRRGEIELPAGVSASRNELESVE